MPPEPSARAEPEVRAVDGWTVLVPVKELAVAKTRLSRFAGRARGELALAFAADTVSAALATDGVRGVLVITSDDAVTEVAREAGADVVPDVPRAGQNAALVHGREVAALRWPGGALAALSADLPALRPVELAFALRAASGFPVAFVADTEGTGTTLLTAVQAAALEPRFGHHSRAGHAAAGVVELMSGPLASVRRDVDTEVDLYDARRLGVGPRTAAVVERLESAER